VKHVFGYHAIEELLRRGPVEGTLLVGRQNERIERLVELARKAGVEVSEVDEPHLAGLVGSTAHKGAVLALTRGAATPKNDLEAELDRLGDRPSALVLVLDGLTDPQNLGAILRSADLFGVDAAVLPSRRSVQETATVARVSAGASAYVPIVVVANVPSALGLLKDRGFWVYGADMQGSPCHGVDLTGKVCLVLGGEGSGMHRLVRERCDALVAIPSVGHVDSFNVSVAAGILMYEVRRQQNPPGVPHR
jgi:23S rRNA (guanosine2251-2'-O)-methyltransferase